RFLNLDVELRSKTDLSPLAKYFEKTASLLFNGKVGEDFQITIEPPIDARANAQECTQQIFALLSALPENLKELFQTCHTRIFDYGFESGTDYPALIEELPVTQLANLANMDCSLIITVYPYSPEPPLEEVTS